jgi:hypothetical protein
MISELEKEEAEVLYVTLHETDSDHCDGERLSLIYTKVLEVIRDQTPGPARNAMVRNFATKIAERQFCKYHWIAIDRLLHQLITIWRQPVQ